ncbi:hypothetical protein OH655_22550 (plasmid) [Pantoea dispersa]|uniref:hypothetical protein n=1 Tax=Pantoea dispersa TaxID=59814 RepID=UPI002223A138|nr:hypothetical protein [Pantoea dispersa]UYV60078.1 hypothetical protein OH655_22550 [Pantoea dispersa]
MNILTQYGKEIIAIAVPLITFILNNYFKGTAKVSIGELHQFSFLIDEPLRNSAGETIKSNQIVNTKSYVIINEGREAAKKLELIFNYKDMHLNVWPVKPYTESYDYNGRYVVTFEYIAPKESFRCEVLSVNTDLPDLLTCRSEQGVSKTISLYPQKVFNKYFIRFIQCCIFLGMATFVYIFILLLQWLLTKTG